jgi:hypothetical protein
VDTVELEKSVKRHLLMLNHGGIGEIKGAVSRRGTLFCREERIDLVLDTN